MLHTTHHIIAVSSVSSRPGFLYASNSTQNTVHGYCFFSSLFCCCYCFCLFVCLFLMKVFTQKFGKKPIRLLVCEFFMAARLTLHLEYSIE